MASANNRVMEDIDHDQATQTTAATGAEAYIEQRNLDRIEIEGNLVALTAKVEKRLKMPMSRVVLGSATGSGPNISSPFQSILSSQNSGALSAAAKEAMEQLDRVLNTNTRAEQRGFLKYIEKVNTIPIHRMADEDLTPCLIESEDWALVKLAADTSRIVYDEKWNPTPEITLHEIVKAGSDTKRTLILTTPHGKTKVLIVAVCGTVSIGDWALNSNGEPTASDAFGDGTLWHRGLLRTTLQMQDKVARAITRVASQNDRPEQILFTGHSAGGAISQILFALSMQRDSPLAVAVQEFSSISCITFAAPPVSQPPIVLDIEKNPQHARGRFIAIINEGDPVTLAQKEYILTLLEVYAKTLDRLKMEDLSTFTVPAPILKLSGQCILLRDQDPTQWGKLEIAPYSVAAEMLQQKLFGNPLEHFMFEYQTRVYRVLELEPPEQIESSICLA